MHSLLVKLGGCGLLIILFQIEGQCANEVRTAVGNNFSLETEVIGSNVIFKAQWYGTLSGQRRLIASCDSDGCANYKTGFIASVNNLTRSVPWYKYVLQVINVSPTLTRIDNFGSTWNIVFIGNEISTLDSDVWATSPAPCFLCSNELPTTDGPPTTITYDPYTRSSSALFIGLSLGVPCLMLITIYISLRLIRWCIAKRKKVARTLGPVSPQPGVASQLYVVQANNALPPVHDQILGFGVSLPMNQVPTAPQLPQEYVSPPDYESLPPSYESVVHFYKPNKDGVIKYIPDPST